MHVFDAVVVVGWVAVWIYWLAAARGAKAGRPQSTRFVGVRLGILLVVFVLLRLRVFNGYTSLRSAYGQPFS